MQVAAAHVIVDRSLFDSVVAIVTAGAAIVGIVLAVVSTIIAVKALGQAKAARQDLVTERRADFELALLQQLSDAIEDHGADTFRDLKWQTRIRTLAPAADMPWLRTVADVDGNASLERQRVALYERDAGQYPYEMRDRLREENQEAIARRLANRPILSAEEVAAGVVARLTPMITENTIQVGLGLPDVVDEGILRQVEDIASAETGIRVTLFAKDRWPWRLRAHAQLYRLVYAVHEWRRRRRERRRD